MGFGSIIDNAEVVIVGRNSGKSWVLISDLDIYRSAKLQTGQHGQDAAREAAD